MTTTLANLLLGVDMEGGENFCDSVYNFLKNQGKDINLFTNSGFGVWSQSDTNKGLATITYDAGSAGGGSVPSVGDAVVGGTSGAVCKVISYTIASGAFATNNATGVVTVGAVSSDFAFVDNETITFDGAETAVINMTDGAVQVGLIQNGGFATDTDPPPGWTASNSTLTTEGAGQIGNCLMVANIGANFGYAYQDITCEVGKIYKVTFYFKKGTGSFGLFRIGSIADDNKYYDSGGISDAAWTAYSATFEALDTIVRIKAFVFESVNLKTAYYDEITAYEITPCATAADTVAMDGWYKDSTADIYRQHWDATYSKCGSFYSLKIVPTAADDYVRFPGAFYDNEEWYKQFCGQPVTVGAWVYASVASHAKLVIQQTSGDTSSAYHTGTPGWEWLEITKVIATDTAFFDIQLFCDATPNVDGTTIVYISQDMMVFGWALGEGMYQPRLQEIVWLENEIVGNILSSLLSQSAGGWIDLNVEADTDGKLPKGCKAILVHSGCNDAGSAGSASGLYLRKDAILGYQQYVNSLYGLANDSIKELMGWQPCDVNGDIDYAFSASGANTLDIVTFYYMAVQLN